MHPQDCIREKGGRPEVKLGEGKGEGFIRDQGFEQTKEPDRTFCRAALAAHGQAYK